MTDVSPPPTFPHMLFGMWCVCNVPPSSSGERESRWGQSIHRFRPRLLPASPLPSECKTSKGSSTVAAKRTKKEKKLALLLLHLSFPPPLFIVISRRGALLLPLFFGSWGGGGGGLSSLPFPCNQLSFHLCIMRVVSPTPPPPLASRVNVRGPLLKIES